MFLSFETKFISGKIRRNLTPSCIIFSKIVQIKIEESDKEESYEYDHLKRDNIR